MPQVRAPGAGLLARSLVLEEGSLLSVNNRATMSGLRLSLFTLAVATFLAGCGGGDSGSQAGAGTNLSGLPGTAAPGQVAIPGVAPPTTSTTSSSPAATGPVPSPLQVPQPSPPPLVNASVIPLP